MGFIIHFSHHYICISLNLPQRERRFGVLALSATNFVFNRDWPLAISMDVSLFSSSATLPPTFSLQDAVSLSSWMYEGYATLYTNGCNQTDNRANCTAACQDSSQVFQTLETLRNCVLYVGIADSYASLNLSSNDTTLADDLVIQKAQLGSPILQHVSTTITACFNAYCNSTSSPQDCTTFMLSTRQGHLPIGLYDKNLIPGNFSVYEYSSQADELCGYIARPSPLNADIGGIGVYASYWIQSGLALSGTFLVLLWGWGTHYICLPNMAGRHGNKATKPAKVIPMTFKTRRLARLTAALTEFQKAQCFFMLAVDIAALANKANGGLLPVSLQQLYDNYCLLASIAISGYLPITTTLLALHMVDMMSAYLLALSGCTVALSVATVAVIGDFKPSHGDLESIQAQSSKGGHPDCGTFDPSVYCLQYQYNDPSSPYVWGIMAYCLIVLSYVFAYHLNAFRDPLNNQTRPWVLRMMSTRTLQFALISIAFVWPSYFPVWPNFLFQILGSWAIVYLACTQIFRLCCAKKINPTRFISIRCGLDLLAWVSWLADFANGLSPSSLFIWVTFTISSVSLLREAYVEDTKIRQWTLKYQHFAYREETLPTSSLGNRRIGTYLRTPVKIIMKASIILVAYISIRIDNLEIRAASHDWPLKFRRFWFNCLYWMIFSGCIVCFVFEFLGLATFLAKVDTKTWTFGQIVAIIVWAPPVCEYFHLELLGITKGFQHRLLPPYRVFATVGTAQPVP